MIRQVQFHTRTLEGAVCRDSENSCEFQHNRKHFSDAPALLKLPFSFTRPPLRRRDGGRRRPDRWGGRSGGFIWQSEEGIKELIVERRYYSL